MKRQPKYWIPEMLFVGFVAFVQHVLIFSYLFLSWLADTRIFLDQDVILLNGGPRPSHPVLRQLLSQTIFLLLESFLFWPIYLGARWIIINPLYCNHCGSHFSMGFTDQVEHEFMGRRVAMKCRNCHCLRSQFIPDARE